MACVILPSEIARLVYGYLVKENLNEIALQFLEKSPYLNDCFQIVKNGYQFNTKLMDKDLQDLLQEYSVIHNLVNDKVRLLCKTSLLYKKIKLKCESLSEILELILFWKYKLSKCEDISVAQEKNSNFVAHISCNDVKNNSSSISQPLAKSNQVIISENNNYNSEISRPAGNNKSSATENFNRNMQSESYSKRNVVTVQEENKQQRSEECLIEEPALECLPMQISDISDEFQKGRNEDNNVNDENINVNNNSSNAPLSTVNDAAISNICLNANVFNAQNKDIKCESASGPLNTKSNIQTELDSQIKIVQIDKENQNENEIMNSYCEPQQENGNNMPLENSSVVFVGSDVDSAAVDSERDQIIVIPIDYYKSQNEVHNRIEVSNNQKSNLFNPKEIVNQDKNEIIFEGVQATECGTTSLTHLYNETVEKNSAVDENILTENYFLRNRHLMFNIDKELTQSNVGVQRLQSQPIPKNLDDENVAFPTFIAPVASSISGSTSAPLIVVSQIPQTIFPAKTSRLRSILPKENENPNIPPVVVVQPLLETAKSIVRSPNKVEISNKKEVAKKVKKKGSLIQRKKNKKNRNVKKSLSMPSIKTPVQEKTTEVTNADKIKETNEDLEKSNIDVEITGSNEEKENLEQGELKKTETPVFVSKRNCKRLSLSTPRRRSHIRALEFETPPKTKEEKKSRTSPKAKVELKEKVERKSVRNTLFKSPIPENSFKSPTSGCVSKTNFSELSLNSQGQTPVEPLNELSIPIATRSPNAKLSDAWENLTGVGCVIGQSESRKSEKKKMWDADLRGFLSGSSEQCSSMEKTRIRKPEKIQKDCRKNVRKKPVSTKKSKLASLVSPKMSLTSKRNTYSINGNEEGSPIRSLLDDLKLTTPFKDSEAIRPAEETPVTKLLRENINTIDIDLSMINTPSFPPTPSIVITPDLDDISLLSGTNYYSPSKEKIVKITDYFKVESDKSIKNETKEMHDKVIDDLVSKAKEIIGIGKENLEENTLKRRPSGKILSMVKIQMLTQCDKKLCENIPINEEVVSFETPVNGIDNSKEELSKSDLKEELEEKRQRALKKIKVVRENLTQTKNKMTKRTRKRKRSGAASFCKNADKSNESVDERQSSWSSESTLREAEVFHSTPYSEKKGGKIEKEEGEWRLSKDVLEDIRKAFPPFQDFKCKYPELSEKSRKKLHYVEHFLKLDEITAFMERFCENNSTKLYLKPSFAQFFQIFYKWLKHPHKHELNASPEAKSTLHKYLLDFNKINLGLNQCSSRCKRKSEGSGSLKLLHSDRSGSKTDFSLEREKEWKKRGNDRKKEEDTEDGFVSILPLKKRKSTVQQVEAKTNPCTEKSDLRNCPTDNVSQTQNFLQDIDVDRFLSQIHGQAEAR